MQYFTPDTLNKTLAIFTYAAPSDRSTLNYHHPDSTHLILSGQLNGDSIYIALQKVDLNKLRLLNRGFHWINEYPYNR